MASFTAGTTFSDGVANDVTAAKLGVLVTNATPTSGFIQDRTAETVIASNDTVLIGDASDSNNLKRITVDNLMKADMTGNINSTSGTIQTLTSSTATITSGTIGGLFNGSLNTTSGTIGTFNSTTATIPTLTSTTLITSGTGTASAPAIVPTGDTNNGLFFPAADNIAVSTNGTERVRVDSSGNVGIGTASPSYKLDITANTNGAIVNASGASDNIGFRVSNTQTGGKAYRILASATGSGYSAGGLVFEDQAVGARMTIDSSGNVGIGVTSPSAKLEIGMPNSSFGSSNPFFNSKYNNISHFKIFMDGDWGTHLSSIPQSGQLSHFAIDTNNTERLRIDSSGNVGIGTTSPSSKLHISGGDDIVRLVATDPYLSFYNGSTRTGYIRVNNTSKNFSIVSEDATTPLTIYTNSNERLRIDSSGNVGIGTNGAVNKLEIVGSFGRGAPVTKTGDFTLADTENWLIVNKGSSCTVTLPAASSWTGREFTIKVITAHTVVSASSNVVPRNSATAGTAILAATAGSWATLVSNGTNWVIMCGS